MTLQREQAHSPQLSRSPLKPAAKLPKSSKAPSGSVARSAKSTARRTAATRAKSIRLDSEASACQAIDQPGRDHEGYLIKELQHLLRARIETRIRAKGLWLSFPHSTVLMTLSEQPGLSGAQLARSCGVTAQTMNGLLVPLEKKGLIVRQHDPDNARVLKSVLTSKGRQLLQQSLQEARAVFAQMLGTMTERERNDFRHLLRRCIDALAQPSADEGARRNGK